MLSKKKTTNTSLLAAIDSASVDNALKGGNLINESVEASLKIIEIAMGLNE